MRRRAFIAKVLAGLATVPLLGKLTATQLSADYCHRVSIVIPDGLIHSFWVFSGDVWHRYDVTYTSSNQVHSIVVDGEKVYDHGLPVGQFRVKQVSFS